MPEGLHMPTPLSLRPVQFVVPRITSTELTVAVVTASVTTDALTNKQTFLNTLITALSNWAQTTGSGRKAWQQSGQDFNVGDLSHYQDDPRLKRQCVKVGIHNLDVTPYIDMSTTWTYDTVLINPDLARGTNPR